MADDDVVVHIEDDDNSVRVIDGNTETDQPDGGVVVEFGGAKKADDGQESEWFSNIADDIGASRLSQIANELIDAIDADNNSRAGYLENRNRAIDLMGLKLQQPKATVGESSSSIEGMSSVTNPLLLEGVLKGWANARAELLPAEGPVKVQDSGNPEVDADEADALEDGFNHYLTKTATEYYPETSYMLLWGTYLGGSGFKKVNRCPMRRRPVSDSVDVKDLIVSDTMKDLRSCGRITHQITMRPSVMKRMQMIGAYRDVQLTQPTPTPSSTDQTIANIQGTQINNQGRPEDQPYTVWESQCELDLEDYAPGDFKKAGIPLPYLVTIDKDSRQVLALRRDWNEDDKDCHRRRMYVRYPYVPGPGFYGTGLANILGNSASAMTAAWREALDAGMFASFPGGLISKLASRQNSSNFRMSPGEFVQVDTGSLPIDKVVMPMPYRDVTPGLMAMMDKITAQAKELGGSAEVMVGEGTKDIPVGTMLAQVEQATKVMAAAHKDMHTAQAEEIELFVELFREHPEDFWRDWEGTKKTPKDYWDEQKLLAALNNHKLVPQSDPNTPTHVHRIMKTIALTQMLGNPATAPYISAKEVVMRCLRALREDPRGLVIDPAPQQQQPDPKLIEAQAKQKEADAKAQKVQVDAANAQTNAQVKAAELVSETNIEKIRLEREQVIHQSDSRVEAGKLALGFKKQDLDERSHALDIASTAHKQSIEANQMGHDQAMARAGHALEVQQALNPPQPKE